MLNFLIYFSGVTDETPREYHCNLGPDGRRRDADERPELCRGTVEFIASKDYMVSFLVIKCQYCSVISMLFFLLLFCYWVSFCDFFCARNLKNVSNSCSAPCECRSILS